MDYPAFFACNEAGGAQTAHNHAMISVVRKVVERHGLMLSNDFMRSEKDLDGGLNWSWSSNWSSNWNWNWNGMECVTRWWW